ncbi:MAG: DUF6427 family protein [Pelobium sp.]
MIQQFRNLNFFNLFLLFILLFLLRIGIYLDLPAEVNSGFIELFSRLLIPYTLEGLFSPSVNISIAAVIVFIQAILFNRIINNLNILGKSTFLPALCYVLLTSIFSPFLVLSPPLICNFFLLFILHKILTENRQPDAVSTMFDLGMVVAIGTLFYFPFVLFVLFLWSSLIILRPFNWREWVSALVGYLTIVFFLGVYYFWNGRLLDFYEMWKPLSNRFPFFIKIKLSDYIVLVPIFSVVLLGIIKIRQNFFKSYVLVRKSFQILFFLFAFGALSFYLKPDFRINHFLLCVIPISVLMAYYFTHASKKWIYESVFIITLASIVYFQFV